MDRIRKLYTQERESFFLLAGVCFIWIFVIWFSDPAYMILSFDDSFYYLKVATNFASGHGVTFDRINPTNGFHPLWMLVATAVATIVGDHAPLLMKTLLTLQVILVYAGTVFLANGTPVAGRAIRMVAAVLLTNFYCAKILVNGQESALQYFLICITLHYWWLTRQSTVPAKALNNVVIGILLGLTALARIDAVVFSAVLIGMPLVWPGKYETPDFSERLRVSLIRLTAFLTVFAPYLIWNWQTQGHLLPVSAAVKVAWAPSLSLPARVIFPASVCAGLFIYWIFGKKLRTESTAVAGFVFPVLVYASAESVASFRMSGAFMPPLWYMPPYSLLLILGATVVVNNYGNSKKRIKIFGFVAAGYLTLSCVIALHRLDYNSYSFLLAYRDAGKWISAVSTPDSLVGSWDAGIMAAHADRRFTNLDGLINSWDYKTKYLDTGLTDQYINEVNRVDYISQRFFSEDLNSPIYRGVDLSAFFVAWFRCVEHHQLSNFLRKGVDGNKVWSVKPHYAIVLSRAPIDGAVTFAQFVAEVSRSGQVGCKCKNSISGEN